MRSEAETQRALSQYANMIRRICFVHLKNKTEVEDVFQDVFLKYVLCDKHFDSAVHEKAWLIRVAINACKDVLKSFSRKHICSIDELIEFGVEMSEEDIDVLNAVTKLPTKYRNIIYLFYYEGYTAVEIAGILRKSHNTIYTWLDRAKKQLRTALGGATLEE